MTKKLGAALLGAMLIGGSAAAADYGEADSTKVWNGHTYGLFNQNMTWEEAQRFCESMDGHLVTITSPQEQATVKALLDESSLQYEGYWIGAAYHRPQWRWVTGEPLGYRHFAAGEPNGSGDYLQAYKNGEWDDTTVDGTGRSGIHAHGFICEWDYDIRPQEAEEYALALSRLEGTYRGYYVPSQGETGLTLTVFKNGGQHLALFDFYNLPGRSNSKSGKYLMTVQYDPVSQMYTLRGYEWLERPGRYGFADLCGSLRGDVFSGSSPWRFSVSRIS